MIVAASVVLGVIFLVAGVSKISAPRQWRSQSADLGVPAVVAAVLPLAEVIVGALLVTQIARRPVAIAAALMLFAFNALLVVRLVQGTRPPCACFGALSSKPIGWSNVVRNDVFFALAVVVAVWA